MCTLGFSKLFSREIQKLPSSPDFLPARSPSQPKVSKDDGRGARSPKIRHGRVIIGLINAEFAESGSGTAGFMCRTHENISTVRVTGSGNFQIEGVAPRVKWGALPATNLNY